MRTTHGKPNGDSGRIRSWRFSCPLPVGATCLTGMTRCSGYLRGERVEKVLRQLGTNEDDLPIESQMVTRRIRAAQQRIEDRATANHPAQSAEEWLERNCPSM